MKARSALLIILIILNVPVFSQLEPVRMNEWHRLTSVVVGPFQKYTISAPDGFTAAVLQAITPTAIEGSYFISGSDTFLLIQDEHAGVIDGMYNSILVSFSGPRQNIEFYSGSLSGSIRIHLLNSGKTAQSNKPLHQKSQGCEEPPSIDQSVWRNGLPDPEYDRIFTAVRHVIIHHSAGSNTNTNYTQVVRDIYLYHTQVNMWSDIGYNYLIARDGTIFKGRDPDGGAQDNVQGAHFCGKNSNTMGICLMGTYTDVVPLNVTVASLIDLITWKLHKESLDPLGKFPFSSPDTLNVISGHRDGCSTECPGDMTYAIIPDIRDQVKLRLQDCDNTDPGLTANFTGTPLEIEEGDEVTFLDLTAGNPVEWFWSFEGGTPGSAYSKQPGGVRYYTPGLYSVQLSVNDGSTSDTLLREDYIKVRKRALPRIFPNPVTRGDNITLEIEYPEEVRELQLCNIEGKIIGTISNIQSKNYIELSSLSAGNYLLRIIYNKREEALHFSIL